ncbi:MAG: thioredoxin [Aquificaceae bacterium]
MKRINLKELQTLKMNGKDFILYVRSEKKRESIKEIFDTDVVVPELEKGFKLDFFSINADEDPDILKEFPLPALVLFKAGIPTKILRGICAWNQYIQTIKGVYFGGEGNAHECPSPA